MVEALPDVISYFDQRPHINPLSWGAIFRFQGAFSGALKATEAPTDITGVTLSNAGMDYYDRITLKLSGGNSIYGKSSHVVPSSRTCFLCIKY